MMTKTTRHCGVFTPILLGVIWFGLLVLAVPTLALAQPSPEGWVEQRAKLVSPEAAQTVINQREQDLEQQRAQQAQLQSQPTAATAKTAATLAQSAAVATALVSAATEYAQLAAALENDPRRIYQFVRNHFAYVPYYGALKGPYLTFRSVAATTSTRPPCW